MIEAVDEARTKQTIIDALQKDAPEKPIIAGVELAGWGNTSSLEVKQSNTLYICGDGQSQVSEDLPLLAACVAIVANMQANIALEIMLKD